MFQGACLCGSVRFNLKGELRSVINCHCGQCLHTHGHYAAYTAVEKEKLEFIIDDGLKWYRSSKDARRGFCKECGGSQICEHGKQQSYCNECGGSEICEHGRQRHQCQVCSGTGIYVCGHCREIGHNRRTCPNLHESFHAAEGNDEEPPHTRAIAGVSDSVAKFANANDTDDPAYAFGGFVAGFVLLPLVGTLISGWLMSKLKKRNLIPWENDDAEQG